MNTITTGAIVVFLIAVYYKAVDWFYGQQIKKYNAKLDQVSKDITTQSGVIKTAEEKAKESNDEYEKIKAAYTDRNTTNS